MDPIIGFGLVLMVLALLGGGAAAGGGGGGGGGTRPGGGGGGGGGGTTPKPGSGGSKIWGDPKGLIPSWFNAAGNSFWISPNCDAVAEGAKFLPPEGQIRTAIEEPTLAEVLAIPNNSAYGFVDFLLDVEGLTGASGGAKSAAQQIAFRFVQEAAPVCADVPEAQWPEPLRAWKADFAERILPWVTDSLGGIEFGGE